MAIQPQKMAKDFKKIEGGKKFKGTDQLHGILIMQLACAFVLIGPL